MTQENFTFARIANGRFIIVLNAGVHNHPTLLNLKEGICPFLWRKEKN